MATTIGTITLDGSFTDWLAAQSLENAANASPNYQIYGALINDPTLGENYVIGLDATGSNDPVIAAGTVIYLNTDQNNTTGYSPFGVVGAEYEVQFATDTSGALQAYLYSVTPAGVTTQLNGGAPLASGFSSDGKSVELAIPQILLTPAGGTAPTAINFSALINGSNGLPADFFSPASDPEYVILNPTAVAPSPTTIGGVITLDGSFADWPAADSVMTPGNSTPGTSDANYQVYGALLSDLTLGKTYTIGIDAINSADAVFSAGTTIYLNTDQNSTTGYSPFGSVGAEYEVQFQYGSNSELEPFLYSVTSAGLTTELNNDQPLPFGVSSDGKSVELGIQQSLLTPSGGAAPTSINFAALINNGAAALPQDFSSEPQFTITDPATLVPVDHTVKKVGIVYSATSAALYFGLTGQAAITAYDDLFMDAQHQAEAAGVSYDILTEADLTNVAKLSQYSALIFPDFQDVQSSQVSAISSALSQVVYNYHVPIITGGEFMTNDETGAPLPGNPFSNMTNLLNVTQTAFGTATYTVTPDATALANNPVMAGYTSGENIGGASGAFAGDTAGVYTNTGYLTFSGVTQPATTLADINIQGGGSLPGVVQTTTGGTNTVFATTGLEGDSNLLQHAIQNAVFGSTPSLTMDITRFKGVVNSRTDMDQSQFPDDVSPTDPSGPGIYDVLLNEPVSSVNSADNSNLSILAYLNQQYDFVGSYYINIGDDANKANNNSTNWAISTPYYDQILEMGNEIGTHSYTHLIDPPTTTVEESTVGDTAAGSTQIKVSALPSYNGATVGMTVTGPDIGAGTIVTAVSGDATAGYTLTIQYLPGGFGTPNAGLTGALPAGSTLTFGVPAENTNFLSSTTSPVTGTTTGPFTYNYEFGQSAQLDGQNIGITVAGAAVPGATEVASTSDNIEQYFQTANLPAGLTGYVSGGWTGVGSGSPNAFGYIDPSDTGSVYIAPDITFDFSEIGFEGKTAESALTDWETLFNQLASNSETPVIVWPWHDYGITDWPTNGPGTAAPGYTEALYQNFIAYAYGQDYEFVTSEDLASRIAAEQAATLKETTSGNVITATVTPGSGKADLGAMALNVTNGAVGQVIQNAGSWYAYDSNSVFLANDSSTPTTPEKFVVTLGATQDDVTHLDSLAMRADLQSVTGDGTNLTVSFTGDGTDDFHVKTPGTNIISIQTSIVGTEGTGSAAPTATLVGDDLQLAFDDGALAISSTSPEGVPVLHNVTITEGTTAVAGATFVFNAPPTIVGTHATPTALDAAVDPFTGVTIGDLNTGATDTLTITLSNGETTGVLTGTGLSGGTNGVYTLSGTAAAVTTALDALVFTPAKGAPGSVTTTTFALSDLSTGLATPTSDSTTTVTDTDPFPPTIVGTHATQTTLDAAVHAFTGVTIGDLNTGATDTLTITLSNSGTTGVLTGASLTGGTNGVYTLSGTAALVTSELDLLTFTPVKGAAGSVTTTTFALSDVSSSFATPTIDSTTTVTDVDPLAPTITSATYTGSATTGHWILTGTATAGTIVTLYDGATALTPTATATAAGTWTIANTENESAIRVYTAVSTSGGAASLPSAAYYVGTPGNDVFRLASEAAVSAAALINGIGGAADELLLTTASTLTDADFAHVKAVEVLGLTGASAVTLGANATTAGIKSVIVGTGDTTITDSNAGTVAVNSAAQGASNTLTLAGSTAVTVTTGSGSSSIIDNSTSLLTINATALAATSTLALAGTGAVTFTNLAGNLNAAGDTGAPLTVNATGKGMQNITTGSGATTINDGVVGATLTVDATALAAASTLTLASVATTTVSNLAGNLVMTGSGPLTVIANGSGAQTVTTGIHSTSITDSTGSMTVNNASGFTASYTLTLSGSASETVINLSDSLVATGLTGTLNVTTKATPLSIATGSGPNTINAGAMTGALTLTGSTAATVTALGGNLTATNDSGALTVTTTGAAQTVTTGSGNMTIADNSTGLLTVNGAALGAGSVLTLTGSGPVTVTNLKGGLNATGDAGALTVTATGATAQNIATGSGPMTLTDSAAGGSLVVDATALGTGTLTLAGSAAKTVNNLAGNLVVNAAGVTTVNATGSTTQSVTTGTGNMSIAGSGSGGVNVNANATGVGKTLTLSGSAAETVTNLGENIVATGLIGALNVTTKTNALLIATGAGLNMIDASLMTGALTLTGSTAATVRAHGNLIATGDSGALTVTTTGTTQTVTTGTGNISITDNSTIGLTVNTANLASGSLLSLTGGGPVTVTNGTGNISIADSSTGVLTVNGGGSVAVDATALGTGTLTVAGSAAMTVNLGGSLVVNGAGVTTVNASGSTTQSVTTGTGNMSIAGSGSGGVNVNANATGAGKTLTLSGSAAETVTNLGENIVATGLTGALNVTTKTNSLSIAVGSGSNTINAGAMTGALTLTGSTAATVTALHGNLTATGDSGTLTVTTVGAAQTVTTGSGSISIADDSTGVLTVNGAALAASSVLTLAGAGAVNVTAGAGNLSIADNSTGLLTVNGAALVAGSALTLTGSGPVTVTNLKGGLDATGDTGALIVTATGTGQAVTTGSGNISIADSTGALTVNAAALSVGNTLTLTGTAAKTVSSLSGSLLATGTAPINVTATGSGAQTITTGSGADTIIDQSSGGDTFTGGGGADTFNVSGHTGVDSFIYSATSDSRNTPTSNDTITGFGNNDLLDFSALNANLHIGTLQAAGSQIAADTIAWVNSGGALDVYINDTGAALSTTNMTNTGLMEITLTGVSNLSASNFHA